MDQGGTERPRCTDDHESVKQCPGQPGLADLPFSKVGLKLDVEPLALPKLGFPGQEWAHSTHRGPWLVSRELFAPEQG